MSRLDAIGPFLEGAQHIFEFICQESPVIGGICVKPRPYQVCEVAVFVDIIEGPCRRVVYHISIRSALKMASKLMADMLTMDADSLNSDVAQSSIREMTNIICGAAASIFSSRGNITDLMPPQIVFNANACDLFGTESDVVSSSLEFADGDVLFVDLLLRPAVK